MQDYEARALSRLRRLPDSLVLGLLAYPEYREAVVHGGDWLREVVFEYLWNSCSVHERPKLLARPLTKRQLTLVLGTPLDPDDLETIISYNDLSAENFNAVALESVYFGENIAKTLLRRYPADSSVIGAIWPKLAPFWRWVAVARSSSEACSDEVVLEILRQFEIAGAYEDPGIVEGDRALLYCAMQDLIEKRPHLISDLCRMIVDNRSSVIRSALADSRYAGDKEVLHTLLGRDPHELREYNIGTVHHMVCSKLAMNPVVAPLVRFILAQAKDPQMLSHLYESTKSQIDKDFEGLSDERELSMVVARAFGDDTGYTPHEAQLWDLLALAKNPNLLPEQASMICRELRSTTTIDRLGKERCSRALDSLAANFPEIEERFWRSDYPDAGDVQNTLRGPVPTSWWREAAIDIPMSETFDKGHTLDATPLLEILGDSVITWVKFLRMLDLAGPTATLREIAHTVTRLVLV